MPDEVIRRVNELGATSPEQLHFEDHRNRPIDGDPVDTPGVNRDVDITGVDRPAAEPLPNLQEDIDLDDTPQDLPTIHDAPHTEAPPEPLQPREPVAYVETAPSPAVTPPKEDTPQAESPSAPATAPTPTLRPEEIRANPIREVLRHDCNPGPTSGRTQDHRARYL